MGRYIDWEDVIDRYPELDTLGGADETSSAYIVYAESFVDGMLSSHYTPPFSSNNMTVRDLSIDCVYWRAGRLKLDDAVTVRSEFFANVEMIKKRQLDMIDTDGNVIAANAVKVGIYSSTESYHTSFGIDDPLNWRVDSDYICDVQDDRT